MAKYEKWLGAGIGWMTAGPMGAMLGFAAGKAIEPDDTKYRNTAHTSEFETNMLMLAAAVIKADGRISNDELQFVRQFFIDHFSADHIEEKMRILNHCIQRGYDPRKACDELRFAANPSTRAQILHFLFEVAAVDHAVNKSETDLIFRLAGWLNVNDIEFRNIRSTYSVENHTKYSILGITQTSTVEEIKTAYRKMVLEYHPDRNADLSPAEQAKAADKFRRIQEAFEKIKQERRIV